MSTIKCDICGSDTILIHNGTRDNPNINVYECINCHTKQLDDIKENDYENGFMNGRNEMSDEEIAVRIRQCRNDDIRRAEMVKTWCAGKDILDFGCGFGGFLSGITDIAKSAVGVEVGTIEKNYLIKNGFDVRSDINEFKKQFDVITLFHVFEHLKNPRKWLNIFADNVKKDGFLFIEVPNANDALLSLYGNEDFADFTYWSAHLYLYTKKSLTNIINENGRFEIESEGQVQRYPLSNHLYWLAKGKRGGQEIWGNLNSEILDHEYKKMLEKEDRCDTLFYRLRKM